MCFFQVFVLCFEFCLMHGQSASWDVKLQSWVMGNDEVLAIACGVKLILHHETEMSSPPLIGTGDCKCILVGLLLYLLCASIC